MADTISIKLTSDEIEMLVDALEVDLEGYAEAAKEARMSNNREDIVTFSEAATRIQMLIERLREHIED
jgi:molecular chaperone DnaK (HSP70)